VPSSPTSSLLIVPPSHSIILLTKVNISRPVRERRQMGYRSLEKFQCWSRRTRSSRIRVLESHGRSREEREERVEVIVSDRMLGYKGWLWASKAHTNKGSITILSSTCDNRSTIGIGDKKVWPCQRFEYSTGSLANENGTVQVTFSHVVHVDCVDDCAG